MEQISVPSQYSILYSRYHHPGIHCAPIAFLILTFLMVVSAPMSRDVDLKAQRVVQQLLDFRLWPFEQFQV
jgi:hypothetical protein